MTSGVAQAKDCPRVVGGDTVSLDNEKIWADFVSLDNEKLGGML